MNQFIGLDGHKNSCTFVVINEKGKVKRKAVLPTDEKALLEFVKSIPGRRHLCIEEGTQSQWFYEIFSDHVHDLAIVQGRKSPGNKDDERDARNLAERFRTRDLGNRIYKVPESLATLKDLVRSYEMLNTDLVRVKNRIKHLYRSRGIAYSKDGCPLCTGRGRCQKPGFHQSLQLLRTQQESLKPLKAEAQKAMVKEANRHPIARILQTAPGFGPVRTAELLSIVINPERFRTSRQFWCYCGLAIVGRSSANWVQKPNGELSRVKINQTRGSTRTSTTWPRRSSRVRLSPCLPACLPSPFGQTTIGSWPMGPSPTWLGSPWLERSQPSYWPCGKTRRPTTQENIV